MMLGNFYVSHPGSTFVMQSSVTPPPSAPTNLVATAGFQTVGLNWDDTVGATSYNVYRGLSAGTEILLNSSATSDYTDNTVTDGTTYYYYVTAVGTGGESSASNEVSALPSDAYFDPTTVATMKVFLKPESLSALNNNDPVTTWTDSSGNGNDVTQATTSKKPLYKTNIINGLASVLFDGVDDLLSRTYGAALVQPSTIFVVAEIVANANAKYLYHSAGVATANTQAYFTGSGKFNIGAGLLLATWIYPVATFFISESGYNGASSYGRRGNSAAISGNAGAQSSDGLTLAAIPTGINNANVYISEALVYNSLLSAGDRTNVVNYLSAKYGIAL